MTLERTKSLRDCHLWVRDWFAVDRRLYLSQARLFWSTPIYTYVYIWYRYIFIYTYMIYSFWNIDRRYPTCQPQHRSWNFSNDRSARSPIDWPRTSFWRKLCCQFLSLGYAWLREKDHQPSPGEVEVGRFFSHDLQGFLLHHPNGGWPWDFWSIKSSWGFRNMVRSWWSWCRWFGIEKSLSGNSKGLQGDSNTHM